MVTSSKDILFVVRTAFLGARAPSGRLLKEGFTRPMMVTTALVSVRPYHRRIARASFAKAQQEGDVLAYEKDYGGYHGYLTSELQQSLDHADRGVLMIGSPGLAAQVKRGRPETHVAVLQTSGSDISHYLSELNDLPHHVIQVDSLAFGETARVYQELTALLNSV